MIWEYVCIFMHSIQFAAGHLLDREDFWWKKKLHFLQQSEAISESFYSHISWSDSFFASFVLDQRPRSPYLKTDLVHWTIGSVLVGDGSGCRFARKNGNWQLLQTLLYQSHAYQQWQQWDLLSALVQTFVRLRQCSQNTLTILSILTILWQYTQLW